MPRVRLVSPDGLNWDIATRQTETLLRAWFDEILPYAFIEGRVGIDDFEMLWSKICVWPMWAWKLGPPSDPDWLTDSRVLGRFVDFRATNGDEGLRDLRRIRSELESELRLMR